VVDRVPLAGPHADRHRGRQGTRDHRRPPDREPAGAAPLARHASRARLRGVPTWTLPHTEIARWFPPPCDDAFMAKFADCSEPPVPPDPLRFRPQVGRPVPRMRPVFVLALVASMAFALGVIVWDRWMHPSPSAAPATTVLPRGCTPLEVEEVIR